MSDFSSEVLKELDHKIDKLDRLKAVDHLISDEERDFTRDRKLLFPDMIKTILSMAGKPVREELLDHFDYSAETATASAFVQARGKIEPKAFQYLFQLINNAYPCDETFKGYHLIAVDGSDLAISYDINDKDTYQPMGTDIKGCNLYHINAAYDILCNRYTDMVLTGRAHEGEQSALITMAECCPGKKCIFIADRNYPTWNVMEHIIRSGNHFLFRSKDIHSANNILTKFFLPDDEFDIDISTTLTTKQTKELRDHPADYRFLSSTSIFDYVDKEHPFYTVHYRIVRFKLDESGEYESIITDLPRDKFNTGTIKKLYHMRWDIEISFRNLKYSADLNVQHAKKRKSIQQEIWARLILYNLSFIIIHHIWEKSSKDRKKYCYVINKTRAIHLVRQVLSKRKGGHPPDLEALVKAELLPVRPGRSDLRKIKHHSFVCFNYRFS
jgi:hypothetical protein